MLTNILTKLSVIAINPLSRECSKTVGSHDDTVENRLVTRWSVVGCVENYKNDGPRVGNCNFS